jgi:hypothetical protein
VARVWRFEVVRCWTGTEKEPLLYQRMGRGVLPKWRICRVTGDALDQLAPQNCFLSAARVLPPEQKKTPSRTLTNRMSCTQRGSGYSSHFCQGQASCFATCWSVGHAGCLQHESGGFGHGGLMLATQRFSSDGQTIGAAEGDRWVSSRQRATGRRARWRDARAREISELGNRLLGSPASVG